MPCVVLLLGPVVVGCQPNRVEGRVDGLEVPVTSAWFARDVERFDGDGLLSISLSSLPQGCRDVGFWLGEQDTSDDPEALAAAWEDAFPANWWQVDLKARLDAGAWPAEGKDWRGAEAGEALTEPLTVKASFVHHTAHRDAAYFADEAANLADYAQVFTSDLGVARWNRVRPGEVVAGRFNTFVVDDAGDRQGQVELRFRVFPCDVVSEPL